jgi:hypothetical protein
MEAELAKQRELERLQEELEDKQEAYERELNKYIVRQVRSEPGATHAHTHTHTHTHTYTQTIT